MQRYERGQVLLIALIFGAVMVMLTASLANHATLAKRVARHEIESAQALALAEAGIDKAVYELNQSGSYSGESDTPLGSGTFSIAVTSLEGNRKRLTATGYVPNSVDPTARRSVSVTGSIDQTIISFRYGVQVGEGGVVMANESEIEGNLFSNGNVSGDGEIEGDVTVAGGTALEENQGWLVQNTDYKLGDTSAHANLAQSFIPSTSGPLNTVSLYLKKTGSPSDITIKIVTDNAGKPSRTALASGSIRSSQVTSSYAFVNATFGTSPQISAGQTYWIIAIASVNASKYYTWGGDSADGYQNGTGKYSANWNGNPPVWNGAGGDMDFKTFMGGIITSLSGVDVTGNAWAQHLSNCDIVGNATYQTMAGCTVGGQQFPGSDPSPPGAMPISDEQIAEWERDAESGQIISGSHVIWQNSETLGPAKINGDLTISNGAILYLTGPLWVSGNTIFSNGARLIVSPALGESGTVLIGDGTVIFANNATGEGNGNPGSYPLVVSMNTGSSAITLSNNAGGVIFYAPHGGITVSNNAGANQITAYKLIMSNGSIVEYESGLQSASFSSGGGGSWTIVPGTYAIVQ